MKLSKKVKFSLIPLLIILNVILRFQATPAEIGADSFEMHIMANSISEFGFARWFLNPLSIVGIYPASYASSMQFLLSGISQSTGIEMILTIFVYTIFIGLLSMFTAYLMAGEIIDNDLYKFFTAFGISTVPSILDLTTWTIPTRGLLLVLAPLFIYLLLKCRKSIKYVPLTFLFAIFLFTTHHLFYFLIPAFFVFFILITYLIFKKYINSIGIPKKLCPLIIITGFLIMFSIPFFTGRFVESSRYAPIYTGYVRYTGILIVPAIGGLIYLILKNNRSFGEWFIMLTLMLLITFIYEQTYMKGFLPVFLIPFAGIGLLNVVKLSEKRRFGAHVVVIFILLATGFSGYYQFLHFPSTSGTGINERYSEESTFKAGRWMKDSINGSAISNDKIFSFRIFAASDTTHLLTSSVATNQIYGFVNINISEYKRYPLTQENFWFNGYQGRDVGEETWEAVNMLWKSPYDFNITYVVENADANGDIIYGHGRKPSKIVNLAYDSGYLVYDSGKARVWEMR